jgi:hypothetical protein
MITLATWQERYKAAVLETDWTKIQSRIQAAESTIQERQRVLSEDHGGPPEERKTIAEALSGLNFLRQEVAEWRDRQPTVSQPTDTSRTALY